MPRIGRAVAAGFPHHVIQRGNNRENIFFEKNDQKHYMTLLKKYATERNSPVIACCLMSNHVHLLTKPGSEESLSKIRYAQGWFREPKTIPIRAHALMSTAVRMTFWEKPFLVMTDEGIIYS